MSNLEPKSESQPSATEVIDAFKKIEEIDSVIDPLLSEKVTILTDIQSKLKDTGIPEDAKLVAAALLGMDRRNAHEAMRRLEYLEALSAAVENNRGQVAAWATLQEDVITYRDPGPNVTETSYHFNVGRLTDDASLKVDIFGLVSVPVTSVEDVTLTSIEGDIHFPWIDIRLTRSSPFEEKLAVPVVWGYDNKPTILIGEESVREQIQKSDDPMITERLEQALEAVKSRADSALS